MHKSYVYNFVNIEIAEIAFSKIKKSPRSLIWIWGNSSTTPAISWILNIIYILLRAWLIIEPNVWL